MLSLFYNMPLKSYKINKPILLTVAYCMRLIVIFCISGYGVANLPSDSEQAQQILYHKLLGASHLSDTTIDGIAFKINKSSTTPATATTNNLIISPSDLLRLNIISYSSKTNSLQIGTISEHKTIYANNLPATLIIGSEVTSSSSTATYKFMSITKFSSITLADFHINNLSISGNPNIPNENIAGDGIIITGNYPFNLLKPLVIGTNVEVLVASNHHSLHLASKIYGDIVNNGKLGATIENSANTVGLLATMPIIGTITNNGNIAGGYAAILINPLAVETSGCKIINSGIIDGNIIIDASSITSYATVDFYNKPSGQITKAKIKVSNNAKLVVLNDGKIEANEISITRLINNNIVSIQGVNDYVANDNILVNNLQASIEVKNRLLVNGTLTNYGYLAASNLTMANANCKIVNHATISAQNISNCNIAGTYTTIAANSIQGKVIIAGNLLLAGNVKQTAILTAGSISSKANGGLINNGSLTVISNLELQEESINNSILSAETFSCAEFTNFGTATFDVLARATYLQNRGYLAISKATKGDIDIDGNLLFTNDVTNTANLTITDLLSSKHIFYNNGNLDAGEASFAQLFNSKTAKLTVAQKLTLIDKSYNEGTVDIGELQAKNDFINKKFAQLHTINESTIDNLTPDAVLLVDAGLLGNVVIQGTLDIDKKVVSNGTITVANIKPYKLSKSAIFANNGVLTVTNNLLATELRNSANSTIKVTNKLQVTNLQSQATNNGNIIADSLENSYFYENHGTIRLQSIYNSTVEKSNGIVMLASYTTGYVKIGGELVLNGNLLQQGTLTALEILGTSYTLTNKGTINIHNFNNYINTTRKSLYSNCTIQKLMNSGTINVQGSTTIAQSSINNNYFASAGLEISKTLTNNGYASIGVLKNSTIINNGSFTVFAFFVGSNTITGSIGLTNKDIIKQNYGLLTVSSTLDGNYNKMVNHASMDIKNIVNTQVINGAGATIIADGLYGSTFKGDQDKNGTIKVKKEINSAVLVEGTLTLMGNIKHSGTLFCDNIFGEDYAFISDGTFSIKNNLIINNLNLKKGLGFINNTLVLYNKNAISINNGGLHVANIAIKNSKLHNNNILEIGILHGGNIVNKGSLKLIRGNIGLSTINGDVIAGGDLINNSAIRLENGSLLATGYSLHNTYANSINIEKSAFLAGLINDASAILVVGGTLSALSATNRGTIKVGNITDSTITNYGTITLAKSTAGTVTIVGTLTVKDSLYNYGYLNTSNIKDISSITNFGYLNNSNNIKVKSLINKNNINVPATITITDELINDGKIITKNIQLLRQARIVNNKGSELALTNITLSDRIIANYGNLIIRGSLKLDDKLTSYGDLIINKLEGNHNNLIIQQRATAKIAHLGSMQDNLHLVTCGSLVLTDVNATTDNSKNTSKIAGDIFIYSSANSVANNNCDGIIKLANNVQQISGNLSLGYFYANTPVNFEIAKYSYCKLTKNINSNKITIYNEGELDLLQDSYLWRYEGYSRSRLIIRINQDLAKITKPLLQTEDMVTFATNSFVTVAHAANNSLVPSNKRINLIKATGGLLYNNKPLTTNIAKKLIYHQPNSSILITIKEVEVNNNIISANVAVTGTPLLQSTNIALINLTNQLLGNCQPINYNVDAFIWHDRKDSTNKNISNSNLAIFPVDVALDKSIINYSSSSLVLQIGNSSKHRQLYSHATNIVNEPALIIATEVEPNISYSAKREDPLIMQQVIINNLTIDGSQKLVEMQEQPKLLQANQDAIIFTGKTPLKIIATNGIKISNNVKLQAANNQHALHLAVPIIGDIENHGEIGSNNSGTGIKITQMISGTITNNNIISGKKLAIDIDLLDPVLEQQVNPLALINNNTITGGISIKSVANEIKPRVRLFNNKLVKGGVLQTDQNTILEVINLQNSYIEVSHFHANKIINLSSIKTTGDATSTVADNILINKGTIAVAKAIELTTKVVNQGKFTANHIVGNNHVFTNEGSAHANFKILNDCIFNNSGLLTVSSTTVGNVAILGDLQLNGDIQQLGNLLATNISGNYGVINNKILDVKQNLIINYLTNYKQVSVGDRLSVTNESVNNGNLTAKTITNLAQMHNTGTIKVNTINNFICNNTGNLYVEHNILGEVTISGILTLTGDVINNGKLYVKNISGTKYKFTNNKYVNTDTIDVAFIDNNGELCINGDLALKKQFINKGILAVNNILYNKLKFVNLASATLRINANNFKFNEELFTNLGKLKINNNWLLEEDLYNHGILEIGILNGNYKSLFNGKNNSVKCGIIKNITIFGSTTVGISKQIIGDVTITSGIELAGNTELLGNLNVAFINFASNQLSNQQGSKIVAKDTLAVSDNNFINYGELISKSNIELIAKLTNNGKISCHNLQGKANQLINNSTITCNSIEDINIINKQHLQVKDNIKGNVVISGELALIDSITQQGSLVADSLKVENNNISLTIAANSDVTLGTLNNYNLNVKNSGVLTVTNNAKLNYYQGKSSTIIINIGKDTDLQQPLLATKKNIELLHHKGKGALITISTIENLKIGKVKDRVCILTAEEILVNGKLLQFSDLTRFIAVKKTVSQNILVDLNQFAIKRANKRVSIIADITCKALDSAIDLDSKPIAIKKLANKIQNYAVDKNKTTIMQMIRNEVKYNNLPPEFEEIAEYFLHTNQRASNQQIFEEMRNRILATASHQEKLTLFKSLLPSNPAIMEQVLAKLNNKLWGNISQHFRKNRQQLLVKSAFTNKDDPLTSVWFASIKDNNIGNSYNKYYIASDTNKATSISLEHQFTPQLKLGIMYSYATTKLTDIFLTGYFLNRNHSVTSMATNIYAQYTMKKIIIQSALQQSTNLHEQNIGANIFRDKAQQLYSSKLTSLTMEMVVPYYINNSYYEINSSVSLLNNSLPVRNFNNIEIYSKQANKLLNLVIGSYVYHNCRLPNNKLVNLCLSLVYSKFIDLTKNNRTKLTLFNKQFNITNTIVNNSEFIVNLAINYAANEKLTTDIVLSYQATKFGNKPLAKVAIKYKF